MISVTKSKIKKQSDLPKVTNRGLCFNEVRLFQKKI